MKLRNVLMASALMALPLSAPKAQAIEGLYVGAGAGINYLQREDFKFSPGTTKGDARANLGPVVVISLGYGFGNGFRAEVEANYRQNNGFNNPQFGFPATFGGQEQKVGGMVNVLYDFVGMVPMVQPYVGLGAGYSYVIEQNLHGAPLVGPGAFAQSGSTGKGSFAYQAILGAALPIAGMPGLAVTAEYRFMGLAGERSYGLVGGGSIKSTSNYNHSLLFGVRYAFNAAPVAAPFVPVDAGAKTFLVFFDWNKSDLTARGAGIVRDAAVYSTQTKYTRIDVDGNADTSGSPGYNQGLSERRARVVAADLVRNGVPQSAISMHAFGDTKLLVPTGPGVREPQNRRVEIVYH